MRRSLRYYWRTNLAVVLGVAVAAAALVGSLLVGDSVKGSLRELALERLGRTDYALEAQTFFREQLADDLRSSPIEGGTFELLSPAIVLTGTAKHLSSGAVIPRVTVLGVRDDFWGLGNRKPPEGLNGRRIVLNQSLAEDLGAVKGEALILTGDAAARFPLTRSSGVATANTPSAPSA